MLFVLDLVVGVVFEVISMLVFLLRTFRNILVVML